MRKDKEILDEFIDAREDIHSPINSNLRPILEVLLDIRELLCRGFSIDPEDIYYPEKEEE